jgi:O-antigen ligase
VISQVQMNTRRASGTAGASQRYDLHSPLVRRKGDGGATLWKWIVPLLFTQAFLYKGTNFGLSVNVGLMLTPDRFVSIIILVLAVWKLTCGELPLLHLGKAGGWILLFALICTLSTFVMGTGSDVLYRLFDFNYNPFVIFLFAKNIPHSRHKLELLSLAVVTLGAYLAINGVFEYRGPQVLVWPKYILDPHAGIQFGRTRGSFGSSEILGQVLTVTFLFYSFYTTFATGMKLYASYLIMIVTPVVIYATNTRTGWISFGFCLVILAVTKTKMKRAARLFIAVVLLGFFGGVTTHFSFWENATLFSRRQNTVNYRRVNDLTTFEMGKVNPTFGIGFGNFKSQWRKYFQPIEGTGITDLEDGNHNTFLGLFAEVGLVGLIPYLVLFYYMFQAGLRVYRKGDVLDREFSLVFLLVVTVYILGGTVGDYRSGPFLNTVLYLLFGTVVGIEMRAELPTERLQAAAPAGAKPGSGRGFVTAGPGYKQGRWLKVTEGPPVVAPVFYLGTLSNGRHAHV